MKNKSAESIVSYGADGDGKMNASKENGKHALENLEGQSTFMNGYAYNVIKSFLEAAIRKLPHEASYAPTKFRPHSERGKKS